ncbi:immunoglobulin superfamily member 5 isoform X2 [Polyodon spathula]|uniref:immunoglobulin superfamily member 5 isoform X2 n=1 Tax=Polyodon spathula TaxID=7913 RepID=UPI001B7DF0F3|nr:immunoglobulin superfamily member 5 isoform X2 [Polyodon spathula]
MHSTGCLLVLLHSFLGYSQILQGPQSAAVLLNSDALFNCTLSEPWVIMTWLLNGRTVLTILSATGPVVTNPRFTSRNNTQGNAFTAELIISKVSLQDSGVVMCDLQNIETKEANLSVQVNGSLQITNHSLSVLQDHSTTIVCQASKWYPEPKITWMLNKTWADPQNYTTGSSLSTEFYDTTSTLRLAPSSDVTIVCVASIPALPEPQTTTVNLTVTAEHAKPSNDKTVLIAVTVTFSAVALIVLIIVGIVFCCKKRTSSKSSYQEEMRKVSQGRSPNEQNSKMPQIQGKINLGFSAENISGNQESQGSRDTGNKTVALEVPHVIQTNNKGHYPVNPKKMRQATVV